MIAAGRSRPGSTRGPSRSVVARSVPTFPCAGGTRSCSTRRACYVLASSASGRDPAKAADAGVGGPRFGHATQPSISPTVASAQHPLARLLQNYLGVHRRPSPTGPPHMTSLRPRPPEAGVAKDYHSQRRRVLATFERSYLAWVFRAADGNVSEAARLAGVDRTTLYRLLEKHELERHELADGLADDAVAFTRVARPEPNRGREDSASISGGIAPREGPVQVSLNRPTQRNLTSG